MRGWASACLPQRWALPFPSLGVRAGGGRGAVPPLHCLLPRPCSDSVVWLGGQPEREKDERTDEGGVPRGFPRLPLPRLAGRRGRLAEKQAVRLLLRPLGPEAARWARTTLGPVASGLATLLARLQPYRSPRARDEPAQTIAPGRRHRERNQGWSASVLLNCLASLQTGPTPSAPSPRLASPQFLLQQQRAGSSARQSKVVFPSLETLVNSSGGGKKSNLSPHVRERRPTGSEKRRGTPKGGGARDAQREIYTIAGSGEEEGKKGQTRDFPRAKSILPARFPLHRRPKKGKKIVRPGLLRSCEARTGR